MFSKKKEREINRPTRMSANFTQHCEVAFFDVRVNPLNYCSVSVKMFLNFKIAYALCYLACSWTWNLMGDSGWRQCQNLSMSQDFLYLLVLLMVKRDSFQLSAVSILKATVQFSMCTLDRFNINKIQLF